MRHYARGMFAKHHYITIAAMMLQTAPPITDKKERGQWRVDCMALANTFAADNRKFDRDRFLNACYGAVQTAAMPERELV